MTHRRWRAWLGLFALALALLALNMAADRFLPATQLDLTQGGLYTLSPGTRRVLATMTQPVTLRLFYSRELGVAIPSLGAYADRAREVLQRYAELSHGRVRVELYDPEPFSAVEDRAIAYGLEGVPVGRSAEPMYFGLVGTNLLDDERTLSFLQPGRERFLEYDLTRTVLALSNAKRPVVGVMSSLLLDGDVRLELAGLPGGDPWVAMTQLRGAFDVRRVALDATAIDPAIQVLIVAHAQDLQKPTLYAIDQFVMRGGRLLALVDPHSEAEAAQPDHPADASSDLAPLLAAWGVAYDPRHVVGDLQGAWRVDVAPEGPAQVVEYPAWFNIGRDGIAGDDPATGDLDQVTVASAGALARKPGTTIEFTPLLESSARAALLPVVEVRDQPDPTAIIAHFRPRGGPYVIAARVHGMLHSAFTGPLAPGAPYQAATVVPANLVVVADSDVLADRFWLRAQDASDGGGPVPFSDNGAFLVNLTGTLAGGDALLGLRGRRGARRPFTRIDAMQTTAELRFRRTEEQLRIHLDEIRKQLDDLRSGHGTAGARTRALVSNTQQSLIDDLTQQVADTQGRLRQVQGDLRRDIDRLEARQRLLDTALVPTLLVAGAIGVAALRRRRTTA